MPKPPEWIGQLTASIAGLGTANLLDLAAMLDPAKSAVPSSGLVQRALSLSTASAVQLVRDLDQIVRNPGITLHDVQTAIMTIASIRSQVTAQAMANEVEIACTAPTRFGVPLRTTYATAMEMVAVAQSEILVVGYVFTEGARNVLEEIARARRDRGIAVTVIGNRMEEYLPALRSAWSANCPVPRVFSCPVNQRDEMSALHAKVLICDSSTALITSANFSHHGLHENIEIGVKVVSSSVARLVEFFNSLIVAQHLIPVKWN